MTKEEIKERNKNIKRLTGRGLELFEQVKKKLAKEYSEGRIKDMPSDGEVIELALAALLSSSRIDD